MSLLDHPTELVQRVVDYVLPEDFENFLLTCKHVYFQTGRSVIKRHNTLRKRFGHFSYRGDIQSSCELLLRIAVEPMIARYIEHADFRADGSWRSNPFAFSAQSEVSFERNTALLRSLLLDSPYLPERSLWTQGICDWCPSVSACWAAIILLTLLPSVRMLTSPDWWDKRLQAHSSNYGPTMHGMLIAILEIAGSESGAALSSLTMPKSTLKRRYDWDVMSLDFTISFLSIPTLRDFSADGMTLVSSGLTLAHLFNNIGAGLEVVELVDTIVNDTAMNELLSGMHRLKVLRISNIDRYCSYWDGGKFVAIIERRVGSSLEELVLTTPDGVDGLGTSILPMKGFKKLTKLEIDIKLLLGPPSPRRSAGRTSSH